MKQTKNMWLMLLCLAGFLSVMVYVIARLAMFLLAPVPFTDKTFAAFLMACEFFILMHTLGYLTTIFSVTRRRDREEGVAEPLVEEPAVAVLVAARHEPREVLEQTFASLRALSYRNKTVYFLDDSTEPRYQREAEEIAQKYQLELFRRPQRHGAKAGVINDCLKTLTHKYVAIFDADQCPLPEFLDVVIPKMEKNPKLAFVQTPQFYSNFQESRVARGSAFQQAVFYEYICECKSTRGAMYCCGTNNVFRREALVEAGGLDESTVTEDFATSLQMHLRGWKSFYLSHVYAFGMGPENLAGYFKQQFRWANGSITVLKQVLKNFFKHPRALKPIQWWEYFLSGSYYFVGFAFFFMMLCPVAYLLFRVPGFFVMPELYVLVFVPYFILSIGIFYMVHAARNYKIKDLMVGQLLAMSTFPVYMGAAVAALLGIKTTFGITERGKGRSISYAIVWPQIAMLCANIVAISWGANRYLYEGTQVILVNIFWAMYHTVALSGIFYFNEEEVSQVHGYKLPGEAVLEYEVLQGFPSIDRLGRASWKDSVRMFFPEKLEAGRRVMCKVLVAGRTIIFDGQVLWSSQRAAHRGVETDIGIVTISMPDRKRLKEVIGNDIER